MQKLEIWKGENVLKEVSMDLHWTILGTIERAVSHMTLFDCIFAMAKL